MLESNERLQAWIEQVSIRDFGKPFRHKARYNARLKSTGGRYLLKSHDIEINPKQLAANGAEEVERIIKHELCHYHLHIEGRGYRHRDKEFKDLLQAVGGSRYCKALPGAAPKRTEPYRYRLECGHCGQAYLRKRQVDVKRYVCGRCRGPLRLTALERQAAMGKGTNRR
ncbi:SprT family protein [Paenibacillus apiarius]|uniref:Protein SprT-like n=1 Tax=Paenibacillus apiarius TaxID=46240 RepID=A0ABT4DUS4_9BACL|nr:SprT family protein [Paenibacillus apiarius]MCY9514396.1 SprT family protein [Paenibacillus apiarius]MCY9521066.1 SprT family protein [Paenibacillus apiarius]MCY9551913.1 SprT family protein [Paenibacillus apiarius]MCY9557800.1 SprT family protein [Paenibacillus apiarius]MCY9684487.1 SprT family protein [Paenibacillus apiarius]